MSFESLDIAYQSGVDEKFTYTLDWAQTRLIICNGLSDKYAKA